MPVEIWAQIAAITTSLTNELRFQRVPIRPIIAAAGQQSHALALTLDDQAIAVVLYFVKPVRAGWKLGAACGEEALGQSRLERPITTQLELEYHLWQPSFNLI
jgi:hypothetical protein